MTSPDASVRAGPAPPLEEQVLELFRACLGRDDVALDDDFFALGGDSLAATRLVARLYERWGVDFQQDVLFRYSTARTLAHAIGGDAPRSTWPSSLVPLNGVPGGVPVFFIPGASANVQVFAPLVGQLDLRRPAYALRAPDLDWQRDVLACGELVQHFFTEIRRQQRRGPYSLAGHAFGGLLAFEIANRLIADDQEVRHLVLVETAPPRPWWRRVLSPAPLADAALRGTARAGRMGARVFDALGWPPLQRARYCFGPGPMHERELRALATLVCPSVASGRDLDSLPAAALCALIAAHWHDLLPQSEPGGARVPAAAGDPVPSIKAHKVWAKNEWLADRHRPRGVFPGRLTIFARDDDRHVTGWRRFTSQPLDVRRVRRAPAPATGASLLDAAAAPLFAREFARVLESPS